MSRREYMRINVFGTACLVCMFLSTAIGQVTVSVDPNAASKEDVQKLFAVMNSPDQTRRMMEQMMAQMRDMNRAQLKKNRPNMSEEEIAKIDQHSEELVKNFPFQQMLDDMVPVYQRHFSKADVDAMISFYSSPHGQKFLHEMPAVMAESMQIMYPRIQREVEAIYKQQNEEQPERHSPPAQSPPAKKN